MDNITQLLPTGITASAVLIFLWTHRFKVMDFLSKVLDIQMTKTLEKNSMVISEVYERMGDILNCSDDVSNVAIVKFHNGMNKLTIHSNIHVTMLHELCKDKYLKDSIQGHTVDTKTMDAFIKLISSESKEAGKVALVDPSDMGITQRILAANDIKRYYSYCVYRSNSYYLVVQIFSKSNELINSEELTVMQVNSMKIGKLLNNR